MMTGRQAKALAIPMTRLPHDNQKHRRVRLVSKLGGWDGEGPTAALLLSDILTCDDLPEEQPPRWHVSAALVKAPLMPLDVGALPRVGRVPVRLDDDAGELLTFEDLPDLAQAAMMAHCERLLEGVGRGPVEFSWHETGKREIVDPRTGEPMKTLHARKALKPRELAAIRRARS